MIKIKVHHALLEPCHPERNKVEPRDLQGSTSTAISSEPERSEGEGRNLCTRED